MNTNFRHSLLIPCYNAAKYVDDFLLQLTNLNSKFNEVLFYDDASTDDTVHLLEKNGQKVIKGTKNMGPGYARNQLAYAAKEKYIHFHDIDDEIAHDFLEQVNLKLSLSDTDVIIGYADWIDKHTRNSLILWKYHEVHLQEDPLSYLITHPLGIINTVYKKSTFLNIGGFNEKFKCWEDADLNVKLAAANASFQVIDNIIAWSLRHNNGISNDQKMCWNCRLKFLESYLTNYLGLVDNNIFKQELKKVQTALINMGNFNSLITIFNLNKKYQLNIPNTKAKLIYASNIILPSSWLKKILSSLTKK